MRIKLDDLTIVLDAAYAAAKVPALRQFGLKYAPEQIIAAINGIQLRMGSVQIDVAT
jgi:hypothetical protein